MNNAVAGVGKASHLGQRQGLATSISERLSQELIIAFVGPVGSGVSTAAEHLRKTLNNDYGYKVFPTIKPREFIKREAYRISEIIDSGIAPHIEIGKLQDIGNKLRKKFGGAYLAEKTVEQIHRYRMEDNGVKDRILVPGRRAYIIDSLKNPEELHLLREIYGETLCMFGVFAPDDIRSVRLKNKGIPQESIKHIMDRDNGEPITFGQRTRKLFVEADFFVCNDTKPDELERKLNRFLEIIFDVGVRTPTRAESAMYEASTASANSACMSRQVGAAIVSSTGELISVGWNDVPRFGGSLYSEDNQNSWDETKKALTDRDHRCFKWGERICHNDTKKSALIDILADRVSKSGMLRKGYKKQDLISALKGTPIDSLIEYSRAIHAEMEAILSVAREGRHALVGASLYTTTYPCHHCARHIVASGIKCVVYIEPYDKSLAIELHNDSITEDPDNQEKVVFRQYDGVAPTNYLRLFRPKSDRKTNGRVRTSDRKSALPVFRIKLDSPLEYEFKVVADLATKEETVVSGVTLRSEEQSQ